MPISTVPVSSNQMLYEMQVPYFPKTEDMSTNNSSQSPQIFHRPPSINNIQNQQNMGTPFFVMPQNQVYPYYQINQVFIIQL